MNYEVIFLRSFLVTCRWHGMQIWKIRGLLQSFIAIKICEFPYNQGVIFNPSVQFCLYCWPAYSLFNYSYSKYLNVLVGKVSVIFFCLEIETIHTLFHLGIFPLLVLNSGSEVSSGIFGFTELN